VRRGLEGERMSVNKTPQSSQEAEHRNGRSQEAEYRNGRSQEAGHCNGLSVSLECHKQQFGRCQWLSEGTQLLTESIAM
jgi:hypothetical protein